MKSRTSIAPVNANVNVNVAKREAELSGGHGSGGAGAGAGDSGRIKQKCRKNRAPYRSATALTNDTP